MPLATAVEPTAVKRLGNFTIATFDGKQSALTSALKFTRDHNTDLKHIVSPPSKRGEPGFQEVIVYPSDHHISTDGVMVQKGQSAGMYSRDCPILFLCDQSRGHGLLLHCGRPAMGKWSGGRNIVSEALYTMESWESNPEDLSAYITAGISKKWFTHDLDKDQELLAPFLRDVPWAIDEKTGGLDVIEIIRVQLMEARVIQDQIFHDGRCTYEDGGLASKRGGDADSNFTAAFIT